jgi:hypothetical protein
MDIRIDRFKLCDLRFLPYIIRIIERLPEDVREDVLNDKSFQILTDDDALNACVLRYRFSDPVKTLVYLNTKILKEPEHQLLHTIASEIAHYVLSKRKTGLGSKDIDDLLFQWGFEKEVEAVRYDQVISESEEYRIGYDWAKKQNADYLMQHFGLYFDQWNDKGLGSLSSKALNMHKRKVKTDPILEDILPFNYLGFVDSDDGKISDLLSNRKALVAGILKAVKEANIQ